MAGKLNHYADLVQGRFERCLIIHLVKDKAKKKDVLAIFKQTRIKLVWWLLNLRALSLDGAFIPDPDGFFPKGAIMLFRDAKGLLGLEEGMGLLS